MRPLAVIRTHTNIPVLEFFGARLSLVLTARETAGAYSLFDYAAPPHYAGPPPHWHRQTSEFFYVLDGQLQLTIGSRTMIATPGEAVHIPPGVVHAFANPHLGPVRFLVQVSPGGFEDYFRGLVHIASESVQWPPTDRSRIDALASQYDTFPPPGPDRV